MLNTAENVSLSLLALSHTPIEHHLYLAMLTETMATQMQSGTFSIRRLMTLTSINNYSTVRRARTGLLSKLSIKCLEPKGDASSQSGKVYLVYSPEEIFARRLEAGRHPYPQELQHYKAQTGFSLAMQRVAETQNLSRREAQVALCCVEGLTNAEIGAKLLITEDTVKFHLRHVFVKYGVQRRAQLISRLLTQVEVKAQPEAHKVSQEI